MKIPTIFPTSMRFASSGASWREPSLFPPRQQKAFHEAVLTEILEERVVSSRGISRPRGVKRKMSGYKLRARSALPGTRLDYAIRIRIIK